MSANFVIVVTSRRRRWPFSWGPFGGASVTEVQADAADVRVYQRDGRQLADPVEIECYEGSTELVTTVGFKCSARLKRRTSKG